jgi:hypothetical protein
MAEKRKRFAVYIPPCEHHSSGYFLRIMYEDDTGYGRPCGIMHEPESKATLWPTYEQAEAWCLPGFDVIEVYVDA